MREEVTDLREHAQRCMRLARVAEDAPTRAKLEQMAREFEAAAARIEASEEPPSDD